MPTDEQLGKIREISTEVNRDKETCDFTSEEWGNVIQTLADCLSYDPLTVNTKLAKLSMKLVFLMTRYAALSNQELLRLLWQKCVRALCEVLKNTESHSIGAARHIKRAAESITWMLWTFARTNELRGFLENNTDHAWIGEMVSGVLKHFPTSFNQANLMVRGMWDLNIMDTRRRLLQLEVLNIMSNFITHTDDCASCLHLLQTIQGIANTHVEEIKNSNIPRRLATLMRDELKLWKEINSRHVNAPFEWHEKERLIKTTCEVLKVLGEESILETLPEMAELFNHVFVHMETHDWTFALPMVECLQVVMPVIVLDFQSSVLPLIREVATNAESVNIRQITTEILAGHDN